MFRVLLIAMIVTIFVGGCSHFRFNAQMCNDLSRDPHSTLPRECMPYVHDDAIKALENRKDRRDSEELKIEME